MPTSERQLLDPDSERGFWSLARGVERARGFALFIAVCPSPVLRMRLIDRLRTALAGRAELIEVSLPEDCTSPLEAVQESLTTADGQTVVSIAGLDRAPEAREALVGVVRRMNLQRERWASTLGCPVVLWVESATWELLAVEAPDLVAWSSAVTHFVPAPDGGGAQAAEAMRQLDSLPIGRGAAPRAAEKRAAALLPLLADLRAAEPTPQNRQALLQTALQVAWMQVHGNRTIEDGVALASEMEDLARAAGARRESAHLALIQGLGLARLVRSAEARAPLTGALALYRALGDRLGEASCIVSLASVHLQLSEYERARECCAEARALYQSIDHRRGEANCTRALGDVHVRLSEYDQARERYEEACALYAGIDDDPGQASCIESLGNVHLLLDEYDRARQRYEEARLIYVGAGDDRAAAGCIESLGRVHLLRSEHDRARECYEEALRVCRGVGDHLREASALHGLAYVLDALSDRPGAVCAMTQAAEILEGCEGEYGASLCREQLAEWAAEGREVGVG